MASLRIALVVGASLALLQAGAALKAQQCKSVYQTIINTPHLTTALAVTQLGGLQAPLNNTSLVATAFIPNNQAFTTLFSAMGMSDSMALNDASLKPLFTAIMENHVVNGKALQTSALSDGEALKTVIKSTLTVSMSGQTVALKATSGNVANIVTANIDACKSYVDVVDAVLLTSEAAAALPSMAPTSGVPAMGPLPAAAPAMGPSMLTQNQSSFLAIPDPIEQVGKALDSLPQTLENALQTTITAPMQSTYAPTVSGAPTTVSGAAAPATPVSPAVGVTSITGLVDQLPLADQDKALLKALLNMQQPSLPAIGAQETVSGAPTSISGAPTTPAATSTLPAAAQSIIATALGQIPAQDKQVVAALLPPDMAAAWTALSAGAGRRRLAQDTVSGAPAGTSPSPLEQVVTTITSTSPIDTLAKQLAVQPDAAFTAASKAVTDALPSSVTAPLAVQLPLLTNASNETPTELLDQVGTPDDKLKKAVQQPLSVILQTSSPSPSPAVTTVSGAPTAVSGAPTTISGAPVTQSPSPALPQLPQPQLPKLSQLLQPDDLLKKTDEQPFPGLSQQPALPAQPALSSPSPAAVSGAPTTVSGATTAISGAPVTPSSPIPLPQLPEQPLLLVPSDVNKDLQDKLKLPPALPMLSEALPSLPFMPSPSPTIVSTVSGAPTTVSGAATTVSGAPVTQSPSSINFTTILESIVPQPQHLPDDKKPGPLDLLVAAQTKTPQELLKEVFQLSPVAVTTPSSPVTPTETVAAPAGPQPAPTAAAPATAETVTGVPEAQYNSSAASPAAAAATQAASAAAPVAIPAALEGAAEAAVPSAPAAVSFPAVAESSAAPAPAEQLEAGSATSVPLAALAPSQVTAGEERLLVAAPPAAACHSVLDIARAVPNLQDFAAVVQAAGAVGAFQSASLVATVFVPTNKAFDTAALTSGMNFTAFLSQHQAVSQTLASLVVPGRADASAELTNGEMLPNRLNQDIKVIKTQASANSTGLAVSLGAADSNIIYPDIPACASIVHIVDALLAPLAAPAPTAL